MSNDGILKGALKSVMDRVAQVAGDATSQSGGSAQGQAAETLPVTAGTKNAKRGEAMDAVRDYAEISSSQGSQDQGSGLGGLDGGQVNESVAMWDRPDDTVTGSFVMDKAQKDIEEEREKEKVYGPHYGEHVRLNPAQEYYPDAEYLYTPGEWWNPSGTDSRFRAVNDEMSSAKADNEATQENEEEVYGGYGKGTLLGDFYKHATENSLPTTNLAEYARTASPEEWWSMMNSDDMVTWYENALRDSNYDMDTYESKYVKKLSDVLGSFDTALEVFGTDADAALQAIGYYADKNNFGDKWWGLNDEDMPGLTNWFNYGKWVDGEGEYDEEKNAEALSDYVDLLTTAYMANAADYYRRNNMAGDQFNQAFSADEIKKLTPLEYWDLTEDQAGTFVDGNESVSPEFMNLHELNPDSDGEYSATSLPTLQRFGTPTTHMLPLLNAATGGKYNYRWRGDRDAYDYGANEKGYGKQVS